jgi:hypothetical protein
LFWTGIFFAGLFEGTKFLHSTKTEFDPPPQSLADGANQALKTYFNNVTTTDSIFLVLEATYSGPPNKVLDPIAFSTDNCLAQAGIPACSYLGPQPCTPCCDPFGAALNSTCWEFSHTLAQSFCDAHPQAMYCVVSKAVDKVTLELNKDLVYGTEHAPDFITDFNSYFSLFNNDRLGLLGLQLLPGNCWEAVNAASIKVGDKCSLAMMQVSVNSSYPQDIFEGDDLCKNWGSNTKCFVQRVQNIVDHILPQVQPNDNAFGLGVRITGLDALAMEMSTQSTKENISTYSILLPLAFLVLWACVRSIGLTLVAIVNLVTSLLLSFLIMYPVSLRMSVISFCPSIMMALVLGLSLTYSLFMLSRFVEERGTRGRSVQQSVLIMLGTGGYTVLWSSLTLVLCFLGLTLLPLSLMRTMGLGAATAVLSTMAVNISLTPTILFALPSLIKPRAASDTTEGGLACSLTRGCFVRLPSSRRHRSSSDRHSTGERKSSWDISMASEDGYATSLWRALGSYIVGISTFSSLLDFDAESRSRRSSGGGSMAEMPAKKTVQRSISGSSPSIHRKMLLEDDYEGHGESSLYARMNRTVIPVLILVLACVVMVPFSMYAPKVVGAKLEHISLEPTLNFPRDGVATLAFEKLKEQFGPGQVNLYRVVIVLPNDGESAADGVMSDKFFNDIQGLFCYNCLGKTTTYSLVDPKSPAYVKGLAAKNINAPMYLDGIAMVAKYIRNLLEEGTPNEQNWQTACPLDGGLDLLGLSKELCFTAAKFAKGLTSLPLAPNDFGAHVRHNATFLQVKLDKTLDPYSPQGLQWLENMRKSMAILEGSEQFKGFKFHVQGAPANFLDTVKGECSTHAS